MFWISFGWLIASWPIAGCNLYQFQPKTEGFLENQNIVLLKKFVLDGLYDNYHIRFINKKFPV